MTADQERRAEALAKIEATEPGSWERGAAVEHMERVLLLGRLAEPVLLPAKPAKPARPEKEAGARPSYGAVLAVMLAALHLAAAEIMGGGHGGRHQ